VLKAVAFLLLQLKYELAFGVQARQRLQIGKEEGREVSIKYIYRTVSEN